MSIPKKHHFVPKSYLESFSDKHGFLHFYSKRNGMYRKQKPNKSMVNTNYYKQDWAPEGVDPYILERTLGSGIEPAGITSLRKMETSLESLDEDDIAAIVVYLEFQRIRVPRQSDMAKSIAKAAVEIHLSQSKEGRVALNNGTVYIKDSFRFDFMKAVSGKFMPYFQRMVWEVVEADGEAEFLTSDSPVTLLNEKVIPPCEPGIAQYGTMVAFPISPKFMLLMRHPEYGLEGKGALDVISIDAELEDGVIEIGRKKWDKKTVDKHNWFMYMQSQDLVAARSKSVLEDALGKVISGHKV